MILWVPPKSIPIFTPNLSLSPSSSRGVYLLVFQKNTFPNLFWVLWLFSFPKVRTKFFTWPFAFNNKGIKGNAFLRTTTKNHFKMVFNRPVIKHWGTNSNRYKENIEKNMWERKKKNNHNTCTGSEVNDTQLL